MTRRRLTLAASVVAASTLLAGCIPGDRVSLLTHSDGGPVGAVAVLDENDQDLAVLDQANQQARLRERGPRVSQRRNARRSDVELIESLPPSASTLVLTDFPSIRISDDEAPRIELTAAQINDITAHLSSLDQRPGYQVLVIGYTDSDGDAEKNDEISLARAVAVATAMRDLGVEIDPANRSDVYGVGEAQAPGDDLVDPAFRKVEVIVR